MTNESPRDELRDPGAEDDREARPRRRHYARPSVDIFATDAEMVVLADLPGVEKSDLEVTVVGDELIIDGGIAGREQEESRLPWGFHRRFKLRTPFERDGIRARLEAGILHITLPKAAAEGARRIAIE